MENYYATATPEVSLQLLNHYNDFLNCHEQNGVNVYERSLPIDFRKEIARIYKKSLIESISNDAWKKPLKRAEQLCKTWRVAI
jgi:hypothetical protein